MAAVVGLPLRSLRIVSANESKGNVPAAPNGAGVETWLDHEVRPYAYTYVANGRYWIHRPGLATFSFARGEDFVTAVPCRRSSARRIEDAYLRFVLPLVAQAFGREVLHASAVACREGVIAFCGDSGAGKSTIAYALGRRDYQAWADDALGFETRPGAVVAVPLPFVRRLRRDTIAYFGGASAALAKSLSTWADVRMQQHPQPLRAIFLLDRRRRPRRGRSIEVRLVPASEAFTSVLPYCQPFTLQDPRRRRRMIRQYLRLSSLVPIFELRFRRGVERLPDILDSVERTVRRHAGGEGEARSGADARRSSRI